MDLEKTKSTQFSWIPSFSFTGFWLRLFVEMLGYRHCWPQTRREFEHVECLGNKVSFGDRRSLRRKRHSLLLCLPVWWIPTCSWTLTFIFSTFLEPTQKEFFPHPTSQNLYLEHCFVSFCFLTYFSQWPVSCQGLKIFGLVLCYHWQLANTLPIERTC